MLIKSSGIIAMTIAAILAASLAVSPGIFNSIVQAAANKSIYGEGAGTVTCSNGDHFTVEIFDFNGLKGASPALGPPLKGTGGSFQLLHQEGPRFFFKILGDFNQVSFSQNKFSLSGIISFDDLCGYGLATVQIPATISGPCGQGVPVQFQAADGAKGQLTANVVCII
jgi:hypothetical protein